MLSESISNKSVEEIILREIFFVLTIVTRLETIEE
jgi:hypothetical protein